MAIGGRRPTPTVLRLITGNPGGHPMPTSEEPQPGGPIERPEKLRGNVAKYWDKFISRAYWLTWADGPKALMWCHLMAEYEKGPEKMIASRIAQVRALGCELGFDPPSRTRMTKDDPLAANRRTPPVSKASKGHGAEKADPAEKYLG